MRAQRPRAKLVRALRDHGVETGSSVEELQFQIQVHQTVEALMNKLAQTLTEQLLKTNRARTQLALAIKQSLALLSNDYNCTHYRFLAQHLLRKAIKELEEQI